MNDQVKNIIEIWKTWNILDSIYIQGLEVTFSMHLVKKKDIPEIVKSQLETYEDQLLETFTENEENLKNLAIRQGISAKGSAQTVISKLLALKECNFLEENEKVSCNKI